MKPRSDKLTALSYGNNYSYICPTTSKRENVCNDYSYICPSLSKKAYMSGMKQLSAGEFIAQLCRPHKT